MTLPRFLTLNSLLMVLTLTACGSGAAVQAAQGVGPARVGTPAVDPYLIQQAQMFANGTATAQSATATAQVLAALVSSDSATSQARVRSHIETQAALSVTQVAQAVHATGTAQVKSADATSTAQPILATQVSFTATAAYEERLITLEHTQRLQAQREADAQAWSEFWSVVRTVTGLVVLVVIGVALWTARTYIVALRNAEAYAIRQKGDAEAARIEAEAEIKKATAWQIRANSVRVINGQLVDVDGSVVGYIVAQTGTPSVAPASETDAEIESAPAPTPTGTLKAGKTRYTSEQRFLLELVDVCIKFDGMDAPSITPANRLPKGWSGGSWQRRVDRLAHYGWIVPGDKDAAGRVTRWDVAVRDRWGKANLEALRLTIVHNPDPVTTQAGHAPKLAEIAPS